MQAAFALALSRQTEVHESPPDGVVMHGDREAARMPVGARQVSGWWESGPSAAVHGFECTGEAPLKQDGEECARGPCDNVQRGATCAGEVKGRQRGWVDGRSTFRLHKY